MQRRAPWLLLALLCTACPSRDDGRTAAPPAPAPATLAPREVDDWAAELARLERALPARLARQLASGRGEDAVWSRVAAGDLDGALAEAERQVQADPIDGPWALRASLRGERRDPAAEAAAIGAVVDAAPEDARGWLARGWALAEAGDLAAALADAERAVGLAPDDPYARRLRGWLRDELGDEAGAEADRRASGLPLPRLGRPRLPDEGRLAAEVAAARLAAEVAEPAARARVDAARTGRLAQVAEALEACWRLDRPALADELLAARPEVAAFDAAGARVTLDCRYRGQGLEVTVARRPGVVGAVAVAFPPGTWGEAPGELADSGLAPAGLAVTGAPGGSGARGRAAVFPRAQDLACLRARVLVLEADQVSAAVRLPVVCAAIRAEGPRDGARYALRRFEDGAPLARLLAAACVGDAPPHGAAQAAVWTVRDGIRWPELACLHRGSFGAFDGRSYGSEAVADAALLLARAGVDPQATTLFAGLRAGEAAVTPGDPRGPAPVDPFEQ